MLKGILVNLTTANNGGTDDHIYLGVFGKGGGSEFPLATDNFDDFESGTKVKYRLGDVWENNATSSTKIPSRSTGNDWNNPWYRDIDLDMVDYVYLRKQSYKYEGNDYNGDDAWRMDEVEVILYGSSSPNKRRFYKPRDLYLANEFGLQVWLKER